MNQLSPTGRFEHIFVAADGSEFSTGAVRVALAMAAKCGARLTAASMVTSNPELDSIAPQRARQAEEQARAYLQGIAREAQAAGVACDIRVLHGEDPSREILAAAEERHVDVIVMGRRGRRGLARLMVGDATAKVVGCAKCSVLVVPKAAQLWQKGIVLATDGSRHSDAAAIAAGRLAKLCGLPLTAVSVVRNNFNEARAAEAVAIVARVKELLGREGVTADGAVPRGQPEQLIVDTAREKGADLIVMGSRGRTALERILLGSVTERVIGAAECPVLAVKA